MAEKFQNLSVKATSLALAATSGIVYAICAFVSIYSKPTAIMYANYMMHSIDVTPMMRTTPILWDSLIVGLILVVVSGAIAGALFAWLYNYFLKTK